MGLKIFNDWFKLFKGVMDEHELLAESTYNMNKKRCMLGLIQNSKVLILAGNHSRFLQQLSTQEFAIIIKGVSPTGYIVTPFIIWAAKIHCND